MSEPPRFPSDFSEILSGDEPPINLWAEIYANQSPELDAQPSSKIKNFLSTILPMPTVP